MTLLQLLTNGPANGTTASTGNTGAASLTTTGGTESWVTDSTTGRTKLQIATSTAGNALNARFYLSAANSALTMTTKFTMPAANPSGEYRLMGFRWGTSSGGTCCSIAWEATGQLRFLDSVNAVTNIGTTTQFTNGAEYVIAATLAGAGNGAGNGSGTIHIYSVGSTTALATATISGANFTTNQFGAFDLGGGTVVGTIAAMDLQLNDGGTTEIADYVPPLATPVVSLGTTTNPTTVGGSNGSQVVTWGAVSNASSYDAYIAHNTAPAQSDFSLVTTGVTSPYTFTGLAAGAFAFGIEAKP